MELKNQANESTQEIRVTGMNQNPHQYPELSLQVKTRTHRVEHAHTGSRSETEQSQTQWIVFRLITPRFDAETQ